MTGARRLGLHEVPPIGLGAMPLSWPGMLEHRDRAIATVHAALDAGCRHIDTSNIYAPSWERAGHNETLVAEALAAWQPATSPRGAPKVVVATKGGLVATQRGMDRDGSDAGLRAACEASRERLGVDNIDLYYLHRPDPRVAFETQVESLERLRGDGLIASIGLSNVSLEQLEFAVTLAPIAAVQNEFSPRYRAHREVLEFAASRKIAYLPWSPFGGADRAGQMGSQYAAFAEVGSARECSAHRVALAWLLAHGSNVIPIPGSTRPETIVDSMAAIDLRLGVDQLQLLDATVAEGTSQYPDDMPDPPPLRSAS
jgi:aryl-alcohol dehydrogenase-like predicted oxidoreductase